MRNAIAGLGQSQSQSQSPVVVEIDRVSTSGFPFFLRGNLKSVALRHGVTSWRTPGLTIDALPINPRRFVFTSVNPQTLDLGQWGAYSVETEGARASIKRHKGALITDAQADTIVAIPSRGLIGLRAQGVLFKLAPAAKGGSGYQASLFAGAFDISREGQNARGEKLLVDAVSSSDGRSTSLDIRRFVVEARGASVELKGVVTVDETGYPSGILDAVLRNPKGLPAFLADLGAISVDEARAARAALGLAALAAGGEIRAPIELKDGEARIAGVKIARLPRLRDED